jgi:DNA invertase Pin-like site-specific DNA recombinase
MNVVLYARVSSERQAEKDLPIAGQLKELRNYARKRGWEIHQEFVDQAESARTANRPAFQEMIALARRKQKAFEAILVWKLSRFARNREDSILYKSLLRKHGVSVISINEQVNDSPSGRLLEGVIEVVDEFYSTNLAQDTIRGMKENASRGFHNGGTVAVGYVGRKAADNGNSRTKLDLDPTHAPTVHRIFRMCDREMLGAKQIIMTLNREGIKTRSGRPWTKNQVYYILKNETYTGTLVWNKMNKQNGSPRPNDPSNIVRIENDHPAIVDRETFERVQKLLEQRSPKITPPRTVGSRYLLSGLLRCGRCGASMIGIPAKSGRYHYYTCQSYFRQGKEACPGVSMRTTRLEQFVVERIRHNVLTEANLAELVRIVAEEFDQAKNGYNEQEAALDAQIDGLRRRLHRLYDALETGSLSTNDLAPRIKELKSQIDDIEGRKATLAAQMKRSPVPRLTRAEVGVQVRDLHALLSKGSIIEQRGFLRTFVKRVEVKPPHVTIEYTIPLPDKPGRGGGNEVLTFDKTGSRKVPELEHSNAVTERCPNVPDLELSKRARLRSGSGFCTSPRTSAISLPTPT